MRRSVKKGGGGRRRKKGKRTAPVSSIHASCLHARSESRRRRLRESSLRGGADWWLPEGLLILWKSASYLKPSNLPPVSRGEAHLFEIPCRHPLDYTRLSSASFPSEEGGRRGMLSVEKSLSYALFRDFQPPGWDSEWFRLNDPSLFHENMRIPCDRVVRSLGPLFFLLSRLLFSLFLSLEKLEFFLFNPIGSIFRVVIIHRYRKNTVQFCERVRLG